MVPIPHLKEVHCVVDLINFNIAQALSNEEKKLTQFEIHNILLLNRFLRLENK